MSKSMRVDKGAKSISKAVERNKNVWATVDNVALKYTLSVYLYDAGAGLPKLARECSYENTAIRLNLEYSDILHYYEKTVDNGGKCSFTDSNDVDDMVRQRMEILKNSAASADSVNAKVHLSGVSENESLVYTYIIDRSDGRQTFLVITSSITPLNTTLEVIKNQMLLVSVAFVLLSLVFSFYASRRIAKPIAQTNRAAKELAKKNYEIEFNASGYREVEELNNTLNYTKTELAATEKLQRELIANISHDLRTPLTLITGYGEVMRDLPGENTPENIQIIIDEATRLSTLVNDLLDLSKLQSGALQAQKQVFNLTDSVRAILERYSKLVEQEGFDIRFESKDIPSWWSRRALTSALRAKRRSLSTPTSCASRRSSITLSTTPSTTQARTRPSSSPRPCATSWCVSRSSTTARAFLPTSCRISGTATTRWTRSTSAA